MCANEGIFSSLDKTSHAVNLGNNTSIKVTGYGAMKLTLHGVRYTISNMYWIPELKYNLLSVGRLQEKRVVMLFKYGPVNTLAPSLWSSQLQRLIHLETQKTW